jgi:hypothetical protein
MHCICAVDLDTIVTAYWISGLNPANGFMMHTNFYRTERSSSATSICDFGKELNYFQCRDSSLATRSANIADAFAAQYGSNTSY